MLSGALQADADVESGGTYSVSTMSFIGRHLMLIEIYLCVGVWVWVGWWVGVCVWVCVYGCVCNKKFFC